MPNIIEQDDVGDILNDLPTDNNPVDPDDLKMVNNIFKKNQGFFNKISTEIKDPLIGAILFLVLSLPFVNKILTKVPIFAKSQYILFFGKMLLFMILFWIMKNIGLSKKC